MSNHIKIHRSVRSSHYDKCAEHYDQFNEENSRVINHTIENILKKHNIRDVIDLTCGTGSQVFWLTKHGYEVVGSDINSNMLNIAQRKALRENLDIKFLKGDMRTIKVGKFDAAITIFNSIGHLTKLDFEKTMKNIHKNLKDGGLYIFDINNLSYLIKDNNITKLTIDWQKIVGNTKIRDIQYSTIDTDGVLASYTTSHVQKDFHKPIVYRSKQTLQVYTAKQLREMLCRNGFEVLQQCGIDGSIFNENDTDHMLTIARTR